MLACKKCHCTLTDGASQQSFSDIESTLLADYLRIPAHRRAMMLGPLCDPCLANWQASYGEGRRRAAVVDNTSPAMKRLKAACLTLENTNDGTASTLPVGEPDE